MSAISVLNAIKKKDDNNLIDLTLFNEIAILDNCDNLNNNGDWNANCKDKARRNLNKSFNKENDGGRVRHSVLEAFDPLLESTNAKITVSEQNIESGKFSYRKFQFCIN